MIRSLKPLPKVQWPGQKLLNTCLIPHYPGEFTVPPLNLPILICNQSNSKRSGHRVIRSMWKKAKAIHLLPVISGMAKEDVKLLRSDIQYIKLKTRNPAFHGLTLVKDLRFYLVYLLLTLGGRISALAKKKPYPQDPGCCSGKKQKSK